MSNYHFGVEIEVIVQPHKIRPNLSSIHALYYGKLAAALRNRGLKAKSDDLQSAHTRRPEHYDKWWITKDGSLENHVNKIPMEAVSPILTCQSAWDEEIDTFWTAMRAVFHMPDSSTLCGSHIHVSMGRGQPFRLSQLKTIAFGVVLYEPLILKLVRKDRADNRYCEPNTSNSPRLEQCGSNPAAIARLIAAANSPTDLKAVMQRNRYVLWNFENIVEGKSGTIEFRGGRGLRGEVRTKRWIACTVSLLDAILSLNDIRDPGRHSISSWSAAALYEAVKRASRRLAMREYLPDDYRELNESQR